MVTLRRLLFVMMAFSGINCYASESFSEIYSIGVLAYKNGDCETTVLYLSSYLELTETSIPKNKIDEKQKIEKAIADCEDKLKTKRSATPVKPVLFKLQASAVGDILQQIDTCGTEKCSKYKESLVKLEKHLAEIEKMQATIAELRELQMQVEILQMNSFRSLESLRSIEVESK